MSDIKNLVYSIENPETLEKERQELLRNLNLSGTQNEEIEKLAYAYWQDYFGEHMDQILKNRIVLISHLLHDDLFRKCFNDLFQEYQDRKKQLGIDDVTKFWAP